MNKGTEIRISPLRILLAFLFAPLCGAATAVVPLLGSILGIPFAFIGLPLMYLSALFFGIPLFFFLKRRQLLSLHHFVIGGLICALPMSILLLTPRVKAWLIFSMPPEKMFADLLILLPIIAAGPLSGFWFWAIGIYRNDPNQSFKRDALKRAP